MAVVRLEMGVEEVALLAKLVGKPPRGSDLYPIRRELERGLARGLQLEAEEKANMERIRRNRRAIATADEPLIPQSVSRFSR